MSRNDFRLRAVLRARKRELDAAARHLADEIRAKEGEIREQQTLLSRLRETSRQLHDRLTSGTSAGLLLAADAAMEASHSGAVLAGERAVARDASIRDARATMTEARKRLRSIEILEERWRDQVRRERAVRDQKRLDEVATAMSGARS